MTAGINRDNRKKREIKSCTAKDCTVMLCNVAMLTTGTKISYKVLCTTDDGAEDLTADPQLLKTAADATPKYPTLRAHDGQRP